MRKQNTGCVQPSAIRSSSDIWYSLSGKGADPERGGINVDSRQPYIGQLNRRQQVSRCFDAQLLSVCMEYQPRMKHTPFDKTIVCPTTCQNSGRRRNRLGKNVDNVLNG